MQFALRKTRYCLSMKRYAILITIFLSLSIISQAEHVVHVSAGEKIAYALELARKVYAESGE